MTSTTLIKYYVNNPARAYEWGRQHVEENGGRLYEISVYGRRNVTILLSQEYLPLLPKRNTNDPVWSGYCERALGWYFGGGCGWMEHSPEGQALLQLIDIPPFEEPDAAQ